jgi:hypothetical protein
MCRSIKRLREGTVAAGDDEVHEAARQFVRKISGFSKPAANNEEAFNRAVDEIAASSRTLLSSLMIGTQRVG